MRDIFFSICIPSFNQGQFIEKCILSCLNQSYKNFEILIVDNNSTDITKGILEKYKDKITVKKIDNDGIIAKSRNLSLKDAKGDWIVLLDTDDYFSHDKLQKVKDEILKDEFDVFCHSEWMSFSKGSFDEIWFYGNNKKDFYKDLIKYGNCLSASASVVKKSFLEKNSIVFNENKDLRNIHDYEFFLQIARAKGKFRFFKEPLGYHIMHNQSTSAKFFDTYFLSLKKLLKIHFDTNNFNRTTYKFALTNINIIENIELRKKDFLLSIQNLAKILFTNPKDFIIVIIRIITKKFKNYFFNIFFKFKKNE